jgi:uncharacterized protein
MGSDGLTRESAESSAVVKRTLEAIARVDTEGIVNTFQDDVIWDVVGGDYLPAGHRYQGKKAVLQDFLIGTVLSLFDFKAPFKFEVTSFHADGDTVIVEWSLAARTVRGRDYQNSYCLIFTVKDGLIQSIREYTNTEYAKRVLYG